MLNNYEIDTKSPDHDDQVSRNSSSIIHNVTLSECVSECVSERVSLSKVEIDLHIHYIPCKLLVVVVPCTFLSLVTLPQGAEGCHRFLGLRGHTRRPH